MDFNSDKGYASFIFQFKIAITDHMRILAGDDAAPPEPIPDNVKELVHFPKRKHLMDDPTNVFERMLCLGAKHHIPLSFMHVCWEVMRDLFELVNLTRPPTFQTLRLKALAQLPQCTLHYTLRHRTTQRIKHVTGDSFQKRKYPTHLYEVLCTETRADLGALVKFHADLHKGRRGDDLKSMDPVPIHFYCDGVSATTTASWKMICQAIRVDCCNLLLNLNTYVHHRDHKPTADDLLEGLLSELHRNPHVHVKLVLCDMPERLRLLCMTNFNGKHGCHICVAEGETRTGAPGVTWPLTTIHEPQRDDASFEKFANSARDTGMPVCGVKSRSPLLDIEHFSIANGLAIDVMHLFAGITKYMWDAFAKKFLSPKQTRELTEQISKAYCSHHFPEDFKRKFRPIDVANYRANEWKQLVALVGVDIGRAYEELGHKSVGHWWKRYTWVMKGNSDCLSLFF